MFYNTHKKCVVSFVLMCRAFVTFLIAALYKTVKPSIPYYRQKKKALFSIGSDFNCAQCYRQNTNLETFKPKYEYCTKCCF